MEKLLKKLLAIEVIRKLILKWIRKFITDALHELPDEWISDEEIDKLVADAWPAVEAYIEGKLAASA